MRTIRALFVLVCLTAVSSIGFGQERNKRGGLDIAAGAGYTLNLGGTSLNCNASYSHNILPRLGVGGGIAASIYGGGTEGGGSTIPTTYSIFGQVIHYTELWRYLDFIGRFDLGLAYNNHSYNRKNHLDIYVGPEAGFRLYFKADKHRALNLRAYYKFSYKPWGDGVIGATFGFTF